MHHVIYVPGVGDSNVRWQQRAISTWKVWGVQPHMVPMVWAHDEPPQQKIDRLLSQIDDCATTGSVSLVGASAGAAAVLVAFAQRPAVVRSVVCIAGKINHAQTIGEAYRLRNPALLPIAAMVPSALQQLADRHDDILSIRALYDPIVPAKDSIVAGARNRAALSVGHAVTIAMQLLFGAPRFVRFGILKP